MAGGDIKIGDVLGPRAQLTVTPEEPEADRTHRHDQERLDASHARFKSGLVFAVALVAILGIGLLCVYEMLFDVTASPETKRWAQTSLSVLFTGCISFLLGQAVGKKAK